MENETMRGMDNTKTVLIHLKNALEHALQEFKPPHNGWVDNMHKIITDLLKLDNVA